ncbi:sulfurtransferase TusA family protein [Vibrio sp. TRT 21S02]|uniref:sulfurtransferase TusA family protein n=1 Tax=unclassified Vibrio TaxID=2614977 RepID=UPI00349F2177
MKPNILDLREERCPMALLLAKRHTKLLALGEVMQIWVVETHSMKDIKRYLRKYGYTVACEAQDDYYCLQVTKGTLLNV